MLNRQPIKNPIVQIIEKKCNIASPNINIA